MLPNSSEKIISPTEHDNNDTDVSKENGTPPPPPPPFYPRLFVRKLDSLITNATIFLLSGLVRAHRENHCKVVGATLLPHTVPNIADVSK